MDKPRNIKFISFSLIMLVIEVGLISLVVDAQTVAQSELSWLLSNMGYLLRWFMVSVFLLIFLIYFGNDKSSLTLPLTHNFSPTRLITHIVIYGLFLYLTLIVFNPTETPSTFLGLIWLAVAALVFLSWCYFTLELKSLIQFIRRYRNYVLVASAGAVAVIVLNVMAFDLWQYLSSIAMYGSAILLNLFFDYIILDPDLYYLGLKDFVVHIAPVCSGLEGLVITSSTTALYL